MAFVMRMEWPEVTPEQYDKVREIVDWEQSVAAGAIFHIAFFDEGGFKAIDIWESPEQFSGVRRQPPHAGHRGGRRDRGRTERDVHPDPPVLQRLALGATSYRSAGARRGSRLSASA